MAIQGYTLYARSVTSEQTNNLGVALSGADAAEKVQQRDKGRWRPGK